MKSILLTGGSGFLGKIIAKELGLHSLDILGRNKNSEIICDLEIKVPKLKHYNTIVHSAGKAHFSPNNKNESQSFFNLNVNGTGNLLKGLELNSPPNNFIYISSVAVYGLTEGNLINESNPLNANDPYGESKIKAEELIHDWCKLNNVCLTILRPPLIAGPNPIGNLGDMVNAIKKRYYFNIGTKDFRKSMVLGSDIAKVIPLISTIGGIYNITDGYHPSVREISFLIADQLKLHRPFSLPSSFINSISKTGCLLFGEKFPLNSSKMMKLLSDLTFDDSAIRKKINWNPTTILQGFKIS